MVYVQVYNIFYTLIVTKFAYYVLEHPVYTHIIIILGHQLIKFPFIDFLNFILLHAIRRMQQTIRITSFRVTANWYHLDPTRLYENPFKFLIPSTGRISKEDHWRKINVKIMNNYVGYVCNKALSRVVCRTVKFLRLEVRELCS